MNNEEAEVKVTQEIPLITGSYSNSTASTSGTTTPFTTIQREEVGTILKVTPHINEGNSVQLKIEQEDSSPGAKLTDSADISTNKRSIKTTVLIEDGGIIVLGGLMSDTVTQSEDRVPGLGAHSLGRQPVQVPQRLAAEEKPDGVHPPQDPARRGRHRKHQRSASTTTTRRTQKDLTKGKIPLLPGEKQPVIPAIPPRSALPPPPPPGITNPQGATPNPPATRHRRSPGMAQSPGAPPAVLSRSHRSRRTPRRRPV